MSFLKILMFIAMLGFAHHVWKEHKSASLNMQASSPGRFIPTAMPDGATKNTVLILAPLNCPSNAAQRANALAEELTQMGIPNVRSNSYSLHVSRPTSEDKANMERATTVLRGEIPAVFVNGMGKANPTVEEVADVYRQSK